MKKLLFLFAFAFSFHVHAADWSNIVSDLNMAYNRSFNTISDGGGKTYTSSITAVSNTTYQNYNFAGGAAIVTNGNAVSNVRITACSCVKTTGTPIFFGNYGSTGATCTNITFDHITVNGGSGQSQYMFRFQNCINVQVSYVSFVNCTAPSPYTDNGLIFLERSSFKVTNIFADKYYGKVVRAWPSQGSYDTIQNVIATNSIAYSPIEIQGTAGVAVGFHVDINNCTLGNFAVIPSYAVPTGGVTTYFPVTSTATCWYTFRNNIVFNTSMGLIDNESGSVGLPSNNNYASINKYYATQALAGFPGSDSTITLPDGTSWKGSNAPPPPPVVVNKIPVASISAPATDTLPSITAVLDGTASIDSDGIIASYAWSQVSGNPVTIVSSGSSKTTVAGLTVGIYLFKLTVTDNQGATNSTTGQISVVMPPVQVCPPPVQCPFVPVTLKSVQVIGTRTDGTTTTTTIQ